LVSAEYVAAAAAGQDIRPMHRHAGADPAHAASPENRMVEAKEAL